MTFSASRGCNRVSSTTIKADFHIQTRLLRNLFFFRIRNWHLYLSNVVSLLIQSLVCSSLPASKTGTSAGLFATGIFALLNIATFDSAEP